MELRDILERILYFVVLPLVSISFVLTSITNDTRIFIAAEAIADKFYPLPYGWDAAYEVKPIGNRILNWVLYKIADSVVPFASNDYVNFGIVVKIIGLLILIICCWYISRRISFRYSFPILFLAMACQATFGILMSEWFSVLLSLVAVSLCLEKDKRWMYLAGAICLCVALLKSITVLLVIPVIAAVYLLGGEIDWKRFIAGYLAAGFAFLALCLTVWPYSIGDMLMSRLVAHVGMYPIPTLIQWFWITQCRGDLPVVMAQYIPILVVGAILAVAVVVRMYFSGSVRDRLLFVVMWIVPITMVMIQSEFIIYHYIVIIIPAFVTVASFSKLWSKKWTTVAFWAISFILVSFILVNSAVGSFTEYEYTFWHQKELNADMINQKFDLVNQTSLLYLDPGDAPFYFHANSSCHYITPMPVERSTEKWNISHLPQYKETVDCITSYQGEYIVTDIDNGFVTGFFGEGIRINRNIIGMIERNYTRVESKSWAIYRKKVS